MFNPNAKLINCAKCGDVTEQEIRNGKTIKNCKRCRDLKNNKAKKAEPAIKYEQQPSEGFYKSDSTLYLNNIKEQEETETETNETATEEEEIQENPQEPQEEENQQEENLQEQEEPREKTIKDILKDVLIKINNIAPQPREYDIKDVLTNIYKQLDEANENILLAHRERKEAEHNIDEFIKQQRLQNKIILTKIENVIKAIT